MTIDAGEKLKAEFDKIIVDLVDLYTNFTNKIDAIKSKNNNLVGSVDKIDKLYSNYTQEVDLKLNESKLLRRRSGTRVAIPGSVFLRHRAKRQSLTSLAAGTGSLLHRQLVML